ncbi:uncharacterized protein [Ptychodera flava]|uniref:uncharacterized protein n=1 Tax=Ptychodera flava TaxID=63121 RepID=UPI00396A3C59
MDKDKVMIIIIAVACVVVVVILIVFILVACHMYKRRKSLGSPPPPMASIDEVDNVVRKETGKNEHVVTNNPAFGKEDMLDMTLPDKLPDREVDLAKEFDGEFQEVRELSETGSNYSFSPDALDNTETKISILDDATWGGVPSGKNDAEFDFNMYNPLRGVNVKSNGSLHGRSSMGQKTADMYEAGQALSMAGSVNANPCLNNTASRMLWQKKRFKNF